MRSESVMAGVMPFVAMLAVECGEVGLSTLAKAVVARGLSVYVFVVYFYALGTFVFLPYFIFHRHRNRPPPITFSLVCRCFLLGLLGLCLAAILGLAGVSYSSPTLGAAIGNLIPAFTFVLAVVFGVEKLDLRRSTSQAKSLGTIVSISGAFVVTLYKGPEILACSSPVDAFHLLLELKSNWILGGVLMAISSISVAMWNILQAEATKAYPDKITIVFLFCFLGTVQCAICALIAERDLSSWRLTSGFETLAIIYSAAFGCVLRSVIITWCLQKKGPIFVVMFKPLSIAIAVVIGVTFVGETLHLGSVIGGIIISGGFYTVMWGLAKERNGGAADVNGGISESSSKKLPLLQTPVTVNVVTKIETRTNNRKKRRTQDLTWFTKIDYVHGQKGRILLLTAE